MNGKNVFVDTNILLYLLSGDTSVFELLNGKTLNISVITEFELLSFHKIKPEEEKIIKELLNDCNIIGLNPQNKKLTISLRRKYNTKLPDSIILASAHSMNLPLLTSDKKLEKVKEVDIFIYDDED